MNKNPFSLGAENLGSNITKINAHTSASTRVYEEIRENIISINMPPDTTLVRAELAKMFNVSQSPVREAITQLEKDGLVISYPQSRTVVTKIDANRIRDEHFLRTAVECEVVRQLAIKGDPKFITKAKGFMKMQGALVDDIEQVALFKQLDEAFHDALFAGVNQIELSTHVASRCGHLERARSLDLPRVGKMTSVLQDHQAIINAIEEKNVEKSILMMREHLSGTMERLPQIIEENRELFS